MKTLGEKLRALRKDRNMTQEDVAFQLGIAPNNYAKIERGESDVYYSRIEKIANIFDMTVIEFINYGEPKEDHTKALENCHNLIHEKDKLIHSLQKELMKALKRG